jgi:hypothetical protein
MALLTGFTFDYHHNHPDFCRLVSIENIHQARHIADSDIIRQRNRSVIEVVEGILARGIADKVFHNRADAIDVHMLISSLCFTAYPTATPLPACSGGISPSPNTPAVTGKS